MNFSLINFLLNQKFYHDLCFFYLLIMIILNYLKKVVKMIYIAMNLMINNKWVLKNLVLF